MLVIACERSTPSPEPPAHAVDPAEDAVARPESPAQRPVHATDGSAATKAREAHEAIQLRQLGSLLEPSPLVRDIELRGASHLHDFHAALTRLQHGRDDDDKVRVLVSSVAGDRFTGYLRGYLQHRFGDGGPGFVTLVPLWRGHRHQEMDLDVSRGWTVTHSLRPRGRADGRYGLMGVRATGRYPGARIRLRLDRPDETARHWTVLYLGDPHGGTFEARLDDETPVRIDTRAETIAAGYATLQTDGPRRRLTLRTVGNGAVHLFGAVIEREQAGVVVDTLGIGGSGARRQLHWKESLWAEHVKRRDPDLFVLAYGGIESMRENHDPDRWRAEIEQILDRFDRAAPDASCLLLAPQDLALRRGGPGRRRPASLDSIVAVLRDVAKDRRCAFFDTPAMMGGPGSMRDWVEARLAQRDHVHFTVRGYAHLGRVLADALMAAYDVPVDANVASPP
jgi:lysophospholipase L1-like esterase